MRRYNTRIIKQTLTYSAHELGERLKVTPNTITHWRKLGLRSIDDHKPYLYRGSDVVAFLEGQFQKQRHKCRPNEFFCCRCRAPRRSLGDMVDIHFQTDTRLMIIGVCVACDVKIHKGGSVKKLPDIQALFITHTPLPIRLIGTTQSLVNCDEKKE